MATAQPEPYQRPEAYLARERDADFRSEYLSGAVYAMAGSSPEHSAITANVLAIVVTQLRGKPCQAFSSDLKIAVSPMGPFFYPDLSVVCEEPRYHDGQRDTLTNATAIVEVLSPSTEAFDRGRKFANYQRMTSLKDYILIAQDEQHIAHFQKQADNQWLFRTAEGSEANLYIASMDVTLHLTEVYDKVRLPER